MAYRQQAVKQQDSCGDLKNSQKSQITDDHPQVVRRTATAVDVQLCDYNDSPRIIIHAVCLIVADLKGAEKKKEKGPGRGHVSIRGYWPRPYDPWTHALGICISIFGQIPFRIRIMCHVCV